MPINILDYLDDLHKDTLLNFPIKNDFSDLSSLRAQISDLFKMLEDSAPDIQGVSTNDHYVTSSDGKHEILVRVYRPEHLEGAQPALYWIHGGGMILGDVAGDDAYCKMVAMSAGCVVTSVEYRLAPEYPHPVPVTDCYDGMAWVFDNADSLGIDSSRIAIGGASAGGGLAAGLAHLTRDRGVHTPCFQLLVYPMLDHRNNQPSTYYDIPAQTWTREANAFGWKSLLSNLAEGEAVSPYASAAIATDMSGLPPAYIAVGAMDLFLNEDIEYAQRLNNSGISCELHVYPGAYHGSEMTVVTSELSQRIMSDRLEALKRALKIV